MLFVFAIFDLGRQEQLLTAWRQANAVIAKDGKIRTYQAQIIRTRKAHNKQKKNISISTTKNNSQKVGYMTKLIKSKQIKKLIIIAAIFFAAMVVVTLLLLPYMQKLTDPAVQAQFKAWVQGIGPLGYLVVLGIQVLQVIVAFIPGEPVEIIAGVLYGGWGGFLICTVGCILASTLAFLLSRRFGRPLLEKMFRNGDIKEYGFLNNSRQLELVVFMLFLIPGTPKDMLTYLVGTTPMKLTSFLLISSVARIPSIVSSTFIGSTMREGDWLITIGIFVITALVGILGVCFKDKILHKYHVDEPALPESQLSESKLS